MAELLSSMIEYQGGILGRNTVGFLVRPAELGVYPGVVVIYEVWGLVDHMKDVAARLAREGYAAIVPDLFDGRTAASLEEGRKIRETVTEEKFLGDLKGAVAYLRRQPYVTPSRIGSVGFCMGGWLSLLLACHEKLAACVVFYGRNPSPLEQVKNASCPVLGNYGGADMGITEKDINLLKEALTEYGKHYDIKVYPGAPHAFFNDTRQSYKEEAAKDSWTRTRAFFAKNLKS